MSQIFTIYLKIRGKEFDHASMLQTCKRSNEKSPANDLAGDKNSRFC